MRRQLLFNSALMLFVGVLQRGMGFVAISCLARVLDPRGLGTYAFTQSTGQTCYGLARLGADAGLHVGVSSLSLPNDRAKVEALLGEGLTVFTGIAVVGSVGLLLLTETIAISIFAAPELAPFVSASAVFFVAQVLSQYCYTCLAGMHAFPVYARVMAMTSALVPILAVSGGLALGVIGAVWGAAIASVLVAMVLADRLVRELMRWDVRARWRWPSKQSIVLLSVGVPFYAGGLFLIPVEFLTIGMLSQYSGLDAMGELRATQALVSIATMLPVALSGPLLSHLTANLNKDDGPDAALAQIKAIWVFSLVIAVGLATLWPYAVVLIFGTGFALARSIGMLTLVGWVPMMLLSVITGALLAMRRSMVLLVVGIVQAIVLGACASLLIEDHGLVGLFAAQAIGMTAGVSVAALGLAKQFRVSLFRPWMLTLSILTATVTLLLIADAGGAEPPMVRLLVGLGLLFAIVLVVFKTVATGDERRTIAQLIASIRSRAVRFLCVMRTPD